MIQISAFRKKEEGSAKSWMITTICLIVVVVGLTILNVWFYIQYSDQKNNVDSKISTAVAKAEKEQADSDEIKFAEREKLPNRDFVGPEDYGRLTFSYPKTWSTYINRDASNGGNYEAYLNPDIVPSVSNSERFSLRLTIENDSYDDVINGYSSLVKKGDLKSSSTTIGGASGSTGTRLEGNFTKDIRGIAVIFKIRDKVVTLRTDAYTFQADFNAIIDSIKYNG